MEAIDHQRALTESESPDLLPPLPNGVDKTSFNGFDLSQPLLDQSVEDSAIQDSLDVSHLGLAAPDMAPSPGFLSLLSTQDPSQAFPMQGISMDDDPFTSQVPMSHPPRGSDPDGNQLFNWPDANLYEPDNAHNLSDQLQISESSTFTFPDDHTIEIPSLKLLNAAMKVALRLNVAHILWDLTAVSPFYQGPAEKGQQHSSPPSLTSSSSSSSSSPTSSSLPSSSTPNPTPQDTIPPHLRPTRTQLILPHHPMLDILPWPSTRDKLIQIFNLPPALRPKSAQDPIGMVRLAYDMEDDGGEGIRIHGADVFEPASWEIGQVVFERWWWAFEGGLVEKCDRARKGRGEGGLVVGVVG